MRARSVGIDLGTTNSCVATIDDAGRPAIIASRQGDRTLPSVVSFPAAGSGRRDPLVGAPAQRQAVTNPLLTVHAAKRLIGRRLDDDEIRRLAATLPYRVVAAPNGDAWVELDGRAVSPQEICAHVLAHLRGVAEAHLGGDGVEAIVTVPAWFDDVQRQATRDAAAIAGLRVRRLLNEPTAAALGYGAHREPAARFAVCDLGGGTFDVSILNVEDGVFEVISTHGDPMLGGEDLDRRILARLALEIREGHRLDVLEDAMALQRLREEAIKAKHALSEAEEITLRLPYLGVVDGAPVDVERRLTRAEIEEWTVDLIDRLELPCREALASAGLRAEDVDQVLLVGGMTRMPAVARRIERIFGRRAAKNANPDEAVAIGAATQCAILDGHLRDVVLLDVTSRTLGIHAGGNRFLPVIPRNASIPTRQQRILSTTRDGQRELAIEIVAGEDPDVRRNRPIGTFVLEGIPEAPAGEALVLVELTIDVDGILHVAARELASGARASVRVSAAAGLSRREVARLARELAATAG